MGQMPEMSQQNKLARKCFAGQLSQKVMQNIRKGYKKTTLPIEVGCSNENYAIAVMQKNIFLTSSQNRNYDTCISHNLNNHENFDKLATSIHKHPLNQAADFSVFFILVMCVRWRDILEQCM